VKSYVVECVLGIFGLGKAGRVVEKALFGLNPAVAAEKLSKVQSGEIIDEVEDVLSKLRKRKYETFVFENEVLARAVEGKIGVDVEVQKPCKLAEEFRGKLASYAIKFGVMKSEGEFQSFMREVTLQMAKAAITVAAARRDLYAVQAIRVADDLDKTLNLFAGHIREWYGLHFPELDKLIDKHETYVRLVANIGHRSKFTVESLRREGLPGDKVEAIVDAAGKSMGAEISERDLKWLRSFCEDTIELYKFRGEIEGYISEVTNEVAPNLSAILGPMVAARLISVAGGLENLAKMPASTIQVLGAEKALFRALRSGAKPPKHGLIFQYAPIHQSPRWQRGKIARALSGKLAIAARVDFFEGKMIGDELRRSLEKKIAEIKEKYKSPPVKVKGR
jgi:nucleolar protein 56